MISKSLCFTLCITMSLAFLNACAAKIQNAGVEHATQEAVLDWGTDEGIARLERSKHKLDFFRLANVFESQKNSLVCGPTSAAIVLNALRLRDSQFTISGDPEAFPNAYRNYLPEAMDPVMKKYTPNTFFNEAASKVKSYAQVCGEKIEGKADYGIQLRQYAQMLEAHGLKVELRVVADDFPLETARKEMIKNLSERENFVLINYSRKSLDQPGGGHISPVGAYDDASDSFLVLDVTPTKAPWVWVKTDALIAAMRTLDTLENRGYLLISN